MLRPSSHIPPGCGGGREGAEQQTTVREARGGSQGIAADGNYPGGAGQANLCLGGIFYPQQEYLHEVRDKTALKSYARNVSCLGFSLEISFILHLLPT